MIIALELLHWKNIWKGIRKESTRKFDNSNVNNSNSHIAIRRDIQTNFPNSNNIAKRKKQNDNIEKFYTYKCGECFMGFKNYDALKQHQLQSHGKVGGMKRSITSNMQGIINEGQKVEELNSYFPIQIGNVFC